MAEHLGKDPKTYAEEYRDFCRELRTFHDIRGTSFNRLPRLHGHEVDLYLLYSLVTSRGGWEKVNINGDWESLLPYFGIHRLCANGPIALKQIYIRFLDVYERIHFLGEEVDRRESELHEEDDARNRRKALRLLHATPTSYNASQHYVPDHVRSMPGSGLSTEAIQVTATERIFLSLLSPLPNEQDFAINVCSLLAMESRRPFPLYQCPRIVDALLAHAGVFSQVDLRDSFTESYRKFRGQDLARFWQDVVIDSDIAQLSEEDLFANQEKVNAAFDSYWTHLLHTSKGVEGGVETTNLVDRDPENTTLDEEEEHFFARPTFVQSDNGRRPLDDLDTSLMGEDDEEEESQSSVGLYENGSGPPSASQSDMVLVSSPVALAGDDRMSSEPSFANCLSKTENVIQSNENRFGGNSEKDRPLRSAETEGNMRTLETILGINSKETGASGVADTNQSSAAPTVELTSDQGPISFLLDSSVEKTKILLPRNRLPIANMKPDNPRAVRYWLDQRRTARAFPEQTNGFGQELEGKRCCHEPEDWELFHGDREHGVHDLLGQRVLQVLNVIRNLSFDDANSSILAQSEACLRLLLLATHAKWSCLPQLAFDALSNMALDINLKDPAECTLSAVLLGTVTRGLESSDRFIVLRCMEILGSFAQRCDYETLLMSVLDSQVFERLCSYLTIPDVALLIYTLECVYALSSLGQTTCNAFLLCQGTIDVLISLLTIEAQSYGSKARILMNVVETVAEGDTVSANAQLTTVHSSIRPAYSNSPASNVPSTPPLAQLQSAVSPVPTTSTSNTKILPKSNIVSRPDISSSSTVISGTVSLTEKEQIAMQWLKSSFEPIVGAPSIEQNCLYRQYTTGCAKNGPKQVLGIVQFFSCVRATFGQNVGPFRKQVGNGVEFYFEGVSPRGSPTSVVQVASISPLSPTPAIEAPGSPILKAQLCAPPKANNRKETLKPSLAHPHLSQVLGPSGPPELSSKMCLTNASSNGPPSSSLIKSLLANKVSADASESNCSNTGSSNLPVTQVASLGLSPTATALPGMTKVPCMNSHVSQVFSPLTNSMTASTCAVFTTSTAVPSAITIANQKQVAQRQHQQKLIQQQQQQVLNGPITNSVSHAIKDSQNVVCSPKVNGFSSEILEDSSGEKKVGVKGMLADLLEREVKKECINGAVILPDKELRISDNGLELVSKDVRGRFAVDMGVVGMNNLTGVDLGDGAAAPKAAHLIAQVDDSGHVQIHLEEETSGSMCNGQSLLDQLEACQVVSSSSDLALSSECKAPKRPNSKDESDCPTPKKVMITCNNHHDGKTLEKSVEATPTWPITDQLIGAEKDDEKLINGVSNGVLNPPVVSLSSVSSNSSVTVQSTQPIILGPHAPRTFLILQPQTQNQQQTSVAGFQAQGQRLLFAIQRPGGVVQHVAMPANVVAISSSQLQTNGGVVTLTTAGGIATIVSGGHTLPVATSTVPITSTLVTTVASTSSAVVTTASVEGMVTFSGGAVAFPARPTENIVRTSNLGDSHVTITPVSASFITSNSSSASVPVIVTAGTGTPAAAVKKRTNSIESPKPRGRPAKSKSTDGSPATPPMPTLSAVPVTSPMPICTSIHSASVSPTPVPLFSSTHQYICEWKGCMKAFKTPHEVYVHACYSHCPAHIDELGCLWEHCDGLKRRRFSMMTHLMDRHCNEEMQKILAARRLQMSTLGKTDIPAPQAPTPHPGYAPHAALHAIKRHAVELMNHKEQEEKEGPVTKSIRLTSALILRNLAIHSTLGRRILKRYEGHLASVALSNVESSRTVAQILFELTHNQSS